MLYGCQQLQQQQTQQQQHGNKTFTSSHNIPTTSSSPRQGYGPKDQYFDSKFKYCNHCQIILICAAVLTVYETTHSLYIYFRVKELNCNYFCLIFKAFSYKYYDQRAKIGISLCLIP